MTAKFMPVVVFAIANWVMLIAFIVFWARNAKDARPHLRTGLVLVALYVALEAVALYSFADDAFAQKKTMIVVMLVVSVVRICAFTVVGLLVAERLTRAYEAAEPSGADNRHQVRYGSFTPTRRGVGSALLGVLFMLAYTATLFRLADASPSAAILQQLDSAFEISFAALLAFAAVGYAEEIVFRLGLQNALTYRWRHSRYGHHWAIVATSALWSLGHIGAVEPDWVKFAQIFVFGLMLGHMNRRFGIGACIIAHSLFNVLIASFSTQLLGV